MMRIVVHVVGDGTSEKPFTTPFPTFQLVDIDYKRGIAIIDVPDADLPRGIPFDKSIVSATTLDQLIQPVVLDHRDPKLIDHLNARYKVDVGKQFR